MTDNTDKAVRAVLDAYPTLTPNGLNAPCDSSLLASHNLLEFELACTWLWRIPKRKKPNVGSYTLKHRAEDWISGYCCNGAMIAAAVHLKFPIKTFPRDPNVLVGVGSAIHWPMRPGSTTHEAALKIGRRKPRNVMFPPPELIAAFQRQGYHFPFGDLGKLVR